MLTVSSEASLNSQRVRFSEAFPNSGLLSQHAGIRAFKAQLWLRTGPAAAANMHKGPGSRDRDAVPLYGKTVSKLLLLTVCQRLGQMFKVYEILDCIRTHWNSIKALQAGHLRSVVKYYR